jgi:hypothetical protein
MMRTWQMVLCTYFVCIKIKNYNPLLLFRRKEGEEGRTKKRQAEEKPYFGFTNRRGVEKYCGSKLSKQSKKLAYRQDYFFPCILQRKIKRNGAKNNNFYFYTCRQSTLPRISFLCLGRRIKNSMPGR